MSTPWHRHVGVAFPEGPELLPFYENLAKRQLLPIFAHSSTCIGHVYTVLLKNTIFFIDELRVRERGRGGRKNRRNRRTGRAYDRTSKRRVLLNARPRKSTRKGNQEYSFDHAVKSFNMVDAFGLLSCSAVHDFVTEDAGSFACATSAASVSSCLA